MNTLKNIGNFFYSLWCLGTFFFMLFLLFFVYAAVYFQEDKKRTLTAYRANRFLVKIWIAICGFQIKVEGWEKVDATKAYIFVGNHCNNIDLPATGYFLQHYYKSLAKKEFAYMPILGFLFRVAGVFVDRKNAASRKQSTLKMIHLLQKGVSFLIFPEGTRNKTKAPLLPFHKGAFKIAIAAQVPIQPFVFLNIRALQPAASFRFYPGTVTVRVLRTVSTVGLTEADTDALCLKVRQLMEAELVGESANTFVL